MNKLWSWLPTLILTAGFVFIVIFYLKFSEGIKNMTPKQRDEYRHNYCNFRINTLSPAAIYECNRWMKSKEEKEKAKELGKL